MKYSQHKILLAIYISCVALFLSGCYSIFNPPSKFITPETASYDNSVQSSGIVDIDYDKQAYIVTKNFVDRYNELIKLNKTKYKHFTNLNKNDGITKISDNLYFIDKQHFSYFLLLLDFKRQIKEVK